MGARCCGFDSRHSDQKSRFHFCGTWIFAMCGARLEPSNAAVRRTVARRQLDGGDASIFFPYSGKKMQTSLATRVNESPYSFLRYGQKFLFKGVFLELGRNTIIGSDTYRCFCFFLNHTGTELWTNMSNALINTFLPRILLNNCLCTCFPGTNFCFCLHCTFCFRR